MTDAAPPIKFPRYEKVAIVAALVCFAALQIVAAQRIGWAFEYPLDDVYIHLAMASEISRGGYGVNSGEYASAASSALYPVFLTPFADTSLQRFLPLIWNIIGLVLSSWIWARALVWAGYSGTVGLVFAVSVPVLIGSVSTAYVGMEHTLHAAASMAVVYGLARVVIEDRLNAYLFIGLIFSPLFRFEGLALCALALIVLAMSSRPWAAVFGAVISFVPIGAFVWYLLSLGLDPLPNSVQAKLVSNDDAANTIVQRVIDTIGFNLTTIGGLAIAGLMGCILFVANITATAQSRALPAIGLLITMSGIAGLGLIIFEIEKYDQFAGAGFAAVTVGILFLATSLFRSLRDEESEARKLWLALSLAGAGGAHILLAQTGWMERYEHYIIASLTLGLVLLSGIAEVGRRTAITISAVAIGLAGAQYAYKSALQYHWGSRAIHLQQYQMQRFAKEFLNRNVAVNDLGWVAWDNPNYVLDLYGLANHEARNLRIYSPDPGWGGPLVAKNNVSVIMIYENFLASSIDPSWIPLGKLVLRNPRGFLGSDEVAFFAANFTEVPHADNALRNWKKTLLPDTCFVKAGEEKCWD